MDDTREYIEAQIVVQTELTKKLRISIDDDVRNNYEFDIFNLNNSLGDYEQEYEKQQQELDDEYDIKFMEFRPQLKSDKACELATNDFFRLRITEMVHKKSLVKKYNRIHRGLIRLGDFITGQKIQMNFNIKNQGF